MERQNNLEKEFSENIDRMLGGEAINFSAERDNDYQTAIDFARKMVTLRTAPSPSFKVRLNNILRYKASELERRLKAKNTARSDRFWEELIRLIPHHPALRALTAVLVVIVVIGSITWGTGILRIAAPAYAPAQAPAQAPAPASKPSPAPVPAPPPAAEKDLPVKSSAPIIKNTYSYGEVIDIDLTVTNVSSMTVELAPYPPGIEIKRATPYEPVRTIPAGTEVKLLRPNEEIHYVMTWDQKDEQGKQVPHGYYYVEPGYARSEDISALLDFNKTIRLLILPPGDSSKK